MSEVVELPTDFDMLKMSGFLPCEYDGVVAADRQSLTPNFASRSFRAHSATSNRN